METESNGVERTTNGQFTVGNKAAAGRGETKISGKVKQALFNFLELNIEQVQESFDKLKPLEKLQFIANILPYVVPKMQSIQSENQTNLTGGITIKWEEPNLQIGQDQSPISDVQGIQSGSEADNSSGGH